MNKVGALKGGLKLFNEERGVVGRNTERDGGTNVAKDSIADRVSHLGDVLVGYSEVKTVFASFGENDSERIGGEVLKFIHVEVERTAIFNVWNVGARHGGELDFGDEESAEDAGVIFANETFRQVDNEDFAFVHDFADIKGRFGLTDNVANDGVGSESADFIEDRRDGFGDLFVAPCAEFLFPEL